MCRTIARRGVALRFTFRKNLLRKCSAGLTTAAFRTAARGGIAIYQGAEASARRSCEERRGLSGQRSGRSVLRLGADASGPAPGAVAAGHFRFLENQTDMIEQVRSDLMRGLKKAETVAAAYLGFRPMIRRQKGSQFYGNGVRSKAPELRRFRRVAAFLR